MRAWAELSTADARPWPSGMDAEMIARPCRATLFLLVLITRSLMFQASFAAGAASETLMSSDVLASRADPRLPVGAPARIVIRYSLENAVALQRATDLARALAEQGLDVADPVSSSEHIASSTVSYFYLDDRPDAEVAARGLGAAWKPVQQRLPQREPFPRPGALELAVAGP